MENGGRFHLKGGIAGGPRGGVLQSMVFLKQGPETDQRPCQLKGRQQAQDLGYRQSRQLIPAAA